jgi:hypothetical protein
MLNIDVLLNILKQRCDARCFIHTLKQCTKTAVLTVASVNALQGMSAATKAF